jgi:hypothetical protein
MFTLPCGGWLLVNGNCRRRKLRTLRFPTLAGKCLSWWWGEFVLLCYHSLFLVRSVFTWSCLPCVVATVSETLLWCIVKLLMFTLHIGPWNQVYLHRYSWGDLRHRSRSSESCRSVPAWRTEALMWVCYSTGEFMEDITYLPWFFHVNQGQCSSLWTSASVSMQQPFVLFSTLFIALPS